MSDELLDGPALLAQALQTRGILLDLIAELRALNLNRDGGMWADDVHDAADRAESRLEGLNDE